MNPSTNQNIIDQQQLQAQSNTANTQNSILSSLPNPNSNPFASTASTATTPAAPQTTAPQPHESGNWLTHLLPTAGGILGSFIPGVGLIGGGALGSAGGKAVENLIEGKGFNVGDELSSAAEGAIGGVGGKILGGVGGALASKGASAAETGATKLVQGQVAKGTLGSADADYLAKNGVTDLTQHKDIFPIVSGSDGAFSNGVRNSLSNAADSGLRMDFSGLKGAAGKAITDAGISGDQSAAKSVQELVDGQLERVAPGGAVTIPAKNGASIRTFENGALQQVNPNDALDVANNLYKSGSAWLKSSSPSIQAQGRALQSLSQHITDNLYGPETAIGKMGISDTVRQQVLSDLAPLKDINPQYYAAKVDELNNANTIGDLRSAQAVDVRANQAQNATEAMTDKMGGLTTADAIKNVVPINAAITGGAKGVGAAVASKVAQSPAANAAGAGVLGRISDILGSNGLQQVVNGAANTGAQTVAHGEDFNHAADAGSLINPATQPQTSGNIMQDIMNSQSPAALLVKSALMDRMYTMPGQTSDPLLDSPGVTQALSTLQGLNTAQSQMAGLSKLYNEAGGAQGPVGGILAHIGGLVTGGPAAQYEKESQALQDALAKQGITAPLPSLNMNQASANSALAQITAALQGAGGTSVLGQLAR